MKQGRVIKIEERNTVIMDKEVLTKCIRAMNKRKEKEKRRGKR